jgi:predicted membrane-bound dolichyl-phosphate-mannose-protein mannosyltransferase
MAGRPLAAGAALGVATLVKLGGVYGCAALLLVEAGRLVAARIREHRWSVPPIRSGALILGGFVVVWFGGLWLLDLAVSPYHYPWNHVAHMLKYGFSLRQPGGPVNEESNPWQWLVNDVQMTYLRVNEDISVNGKVVATRPIVSFRGAMNPIVIGMAPLAISYAAWRAWRLRDRLSIWVVAWVVATYFSFYPLVLISQRTTYIFYVLPALPAVAVAIAQLLRQARLPRFVVAGYLVGLLVGFAEYFPFRRIF